MVASILSCKRDCFAKKPPLPVCQTENSITVWRMTDSPKAIRKTPFSLKTEGEAIEYCSTKGSLDIDTWLCKTKRYGTVVP